MDTRHAYPAGRNLRERAMSWEELSEANKCFCVATSLELGVESFHEQPNVPEVIIDRETADLLVDAIEEAIKLLRLRAERPVPL
jgi:hypothetical protein